MVLCQKILIPLEFFIYFLTIQRRGVDLAIIPEEAHETEDFRFWKKTYWSDFKFIKPCFNIPAIFGGLSLICLNIGSNISFGSIVMLGDTELVERTDCKVVCKAAVLLEEAGYEDPGLVYLERLPVFKG